MMMYLYLCQCIGDYAQWKEGFDTHLSARQAGGATNETLVLRNIDDPREIIVILGWRDLATARSFSQSVSLQMALQTMGVVGVPEVRFLKRVEHETIAHRPSFEAWNWIPINPGKLPDTNRGMPP